jgi:hypothetical protein
VLQVDYCALPLCRDAESLRRTGDLQGALKLYRYIQEEVDVDEKVLRKPLLWFPIAVLHGELQQPQQGLDALQKYQQYLSAHPEAEPPVGQRREDIDRLTRELRAHLGRIRVASKADGLRVQVDGQEIGVTPLASPLPVVPGKHSVRIGGVSAETQELEVPSGQEVLLWALPTAAPQQTGVDAASANGRRPRWRIALGTVGIGLGVTLGAFGIAALAADGSCANPDAAGHCPLVPSSAGGPVSNVVDGRATGGSLLALGLLSAAAGTILIALPGKRLPVRVAARFANGATLDLAASF